MKKLLITTTFLIQLISLTNLDAQDILETKVVKEIQEYAADHFVVNVTDILVKGEHLFMVDRGLTAIFKTDLELNFISKFGEQGIGPNEMQRPEFLLSDGLSPNIYLLDGYHRKVLEYSQDGKLIGTPFKVETSLIRHPLIMGSVLYYTSSKDPSTDIKVYDIANRRAMSGITIKGDFRKSPLGRDMHPYKNQIISIVNYSPPVIEIFNKDWELTNTFDPSENPLIAKRVAYKQPSGLSISGPGKSQMKLVASGEVIIKCSRLYKDKLFLLTGTMDGPEDTITNTIFTYKFEVNTWVQKEQINLPKEGNYSTFALIDNNKLVAFEWVSSTLQLLELVK